MKIAICDDEKKLRQDLRRLLEVHLDLKGISYQIEEYESGDPLLRDSRKGKLDLLFLDIEMPGKGGMDTAKALRLAGEKMLIIFVTAYPDYVFQGYEVQAFHYILKPYREMKIKEVLDSALKELGTRQAQYYTIEQKSGIQRINLEKISYFKSEKRSICAVWTDGNTTVFYGKLDEVDREMPAFFQRVHNRYLVNMNYITKIEGTQCICNGEEIPVSRTYKQDVAVAFARTMLR